MNFCPNCGNKLIPNAKFCDSCGQAVSSISSNVDKAVNVNSQNQTQKNTCPGCGAPINSFAARCSACGCEINSKIGSLSCKELCDKLDQIEASRPPKKFFSVVKGLVNHVMDKSQQLEETDQRKIELISNFIIVNNKVEILDFIMLARSRINSCEKILEVYDDDYSQLLHNQMIEVWNVKLAEAIEKGEIVLADDKEFLKIKKSIDDDRSRRFREDGLCSYCGGDFKGIFNKVCSVCGKPKNY